MHQTLYISLCARRIPLLPSKLTVSERPITMKEVKAAAHSGKLLEVFGAGEWAVIILKPKNGVEHNIFFRYGRCCMSREEHWIHGRKYRRARWPRRLRFHHQDYSR